MKVMAPEGGSSPASAQAGQVRTRRGEIAPSFSVTEAREELAHVINLTSQHGVSTITRQGTGTFVLLSFDEYSTLVERGRRKLDAAAEEFDAMVSRMQAPDYDDRMRAALSASPAEFGQAALRLANKKKRAR